MKENKHFFFAFRSLSHTHTHTLTIHSSDGIYRQPNVRELFRGGGILLRLFLYLHEFHVIYFFDLRLLSINTTAKAWSTAMSERFSIHKCVVMLPLMLLVSLPLLPLVLLLMVMVAQRFDCK